MPMIQIGRYRLGFAPFSMIIVFIVLTICAVVTACGQCRPEWSMPFLYLLLIYEGMALIATLIYGIFAHIVTTATGRHRK